MFCSQCGAPMGDNDKFCGACGAPNPAAGGAGSATDQPTVVQTPIQPEPQPKGCLAQAFHDMTKLPGVFRRVCQIGFLPALIGIVSVLVLFIPVIGGILCAVGFLAAYVAAVCGSGYGIEWGRDLSTGAEDGMERPLIRSTSFGLGIFSSVISGVLTLIAAIPALGVLLSVVESAVMADAGSYYYGGSGAFGYALVASFGLFVIAIIVSVVLYVFLKMFADAAVMHFAVTGRIESAFSLDKVWAAYRHNKSKLFCASILPELLVGIVSNVIIWILTAVFGAIAAASYSYSFYGYGFSYSRPSGFAAIASVGGATLVIYLVLVVFVAVFLNVFGTMLKHRAVGYWAQRYASEWSDEDTGDVLTFVLPGEHKPGAGTEQAPAPAPSDTASPAPSAAPAPAPAPDAAPAPAPAPSPNTAPASAPAPAPSPSAASATDSTVPSPTAPSPEASTASDAESAAPAPENPTSPIGPSTVFPDIDPNDENPFDE